MRSSRQSFYLYNKRRRINGKRLLIPFILLICILSITYFTSYQNLKLTRAPSALTIPGRFAATFPKEGESAVGTSNFGVVSSSPDQSPVPIASLAKIMAAYLVLKAHPLKPGENGPTLTMTAKDVRIYLKDSAASDSVLPVAQGERLTEKQLLEGLLLPSGDNIAHILGQWVSGSDAAFVAEMNKTAQSLGMTKTHYADVSGANPATVSNAVDQMKIAQIAMANPVFREIVAMPQATLPVAGTVFNVNSLLGKHGIVGIKTGSSLEAGGCFASATPLVAGKQTYYIIAVTLDQKTGEPLRSALDADAKILHQVRPEFKLYPITPPSTGFGQVTDNWHSDSTLYAAKPIKVFGYPGMTIPLSVNLKNTKTPLPRDKDIATLSIRLKHAVQNVPLQNSQQINSPSFSWRLIR